MQKFTRSLTREIEVAGERLAVTFSEEGLSLRPVGSRRPPHDLSWEACVCACTNHGRAGPTPEEVRSALDALKAGPNQPAGDSESAKEEPGAVSEPPATKSSLRDLLARLDAWGHSHRPHYQKGLQPGATEAELTALQSALGIALPEELRTWLEWHNGQSPEVFGALQEDWRPMTTAEIAKAKAELDREGHAGWRRTWLPFLDDDNGDYLCLDSETPGAPVRECWRGQTEHAVAAPSLAAWVARFLHELQHGEYTEDPERGGLHRTAEPTPSGTRA